MGDEIVKRSEWDEERTHIIYFSEKKICSLKVKPPHRIEYNRWLFWFYLLLPLYYFISFHHCPERKPPTSPYYQPHRSSLSTWTCSLHSLRIASLFFSLSFQHHLCFHFPAESVWHSALHSCAYTEHTDNNTHSLWAIFDVIGKCSVFTSHLNGKENEWIDCIYSEADTRSQPLVHSKKCMHAIASARSSPNARACVGQIAPKSEGTTNVWRNSARI